MNRNALTRVPLVLLLFLAALAGVAGLAATAPAPAQAFCSYQNLNPKQIGRKEARESVKCLINQERRRHGKRAYSGDRRLVDAAVRHSRTMAEKSCLSHECPGEGSLLSRLKNTGYIHGGLSRYAYGENIAGRVDHAGSPGKVVDAWMNSSGHRSAILSGTFRDIGVGFENRGDKGYFTADFGLRRK
jgi:uncharacterized protein YkwD